MVLLDDDVKSCSGTPGGPNLTPNTFNRINKTPNPERNKEIKETRHILFKDIIIIILFNNNWVRVLLRVQY